MGWNVGNSVLAPVAANAGSPISYTQEYIDQKTQYVHILGISGHSTTYRIAGDSMEPIVSDGDYVVTRQIGTFEDMVNYRMYVVNTLQSGTYAKYVYRMSEGVLMMPTNTLNYKQEFVAYDKIGSVYEIVALIRHKLDNVSVSPKLDLEHTINISNNIQNGKKGRSNNKKTKK